MNDDSRWQNMPLARRDFLKTAAASAVAVTATRGSLIAGAPDAATLVAGKDPRLLVHTAKPAVFETPAALLTDQVTPTPLLFIRNNQQPESAATIRPLDLAGWKIELAGLIDKPVTFDAATLAGLEQVEIEMVLQCSGNGRSQFASTAATKGTQWGRGGMGNVRLKGVPLKAVVEHHQVHVQPAARFLTAEGRDDPPPGEQDFEHSIPLDEALAKSFLALTLNGQPLPAIHGGPVRLFTPGYYGTMHVKWLSRLRFETKESDHTSQIPHYRTPKQPIPPGKPFTATYENSEPNWRMKLKCVVLSPAAGASLPAAETEVAGVAFNDGQTRIASVQLSTDGGRTWQDARLQVPQSPYAWYRWQARVKLPSGKSQIWARAVDADGRSQPLEGGIDWNPSGYTWNGVEKIDVAVR